MSEERRVFGFESSNALTSLDLFIECRGRSEILNRSIPHENSVHINELVRVQQRQAVVSERSLEVRC
jgi:hypothetical protein